MSARSVETLNKTISDYLKRKNIFNEDAPWEIKRSNLGGFGVFAKRDIDAGAVIFLDSPVILGPRCALDPVKICVKCCNKNNLKSCKNNCGLPVCSEICQNSNDHQRECKLIRQMKTRGINEDDSVKMLKCLTPIRSLLLDNEDKEVVRNLKSHKGRHHGYEVDVLLQELLFDMKEDDINFVKFVCSVLDANAFEVITGNEANQSSLRGLYPLGSLANHRCFPNTLHVFDDKQRMVARAAVFIQKGTEIFHSYSRIIWGTTTRLFHLSRTKHFVCKCDRCSDPTEFRTYMCAIYCDKCKGRVIPVDALRTSGNWECEDCKGAVPAKDVGKVMSLLGSILRGFDNTDFALMYRFLNGKLASLVPENNQVVVELKYKIIWILGYEKGFSWKELPVELLHIKKGFCENILTLLEQLRTGQCKMRGLLLYELYECLKEMKFREGKVNNVDKQNIEKYLDEASNILKFDVSVPDIIKQRWQILK